MSILKTMNKISKIIVITILLSALVLSGCVEKPKFQPSYINPIKSSATILRVLEITDNEGQNFSNMQTGWYDPVSKQNAMRFTDKQLGLTHRKLTVYYVYDAPTELRLLTSMPDIYMTSERKHPINNYPRAPTSKGIHRVWKVDIIYDTPSKEELPIAASWNDGSNLRLMKIAVFSGAGVTSFEIIIQEPSDSGFKKGFS